MTRAAQQWVSHAPGKKHAETQSGSPAAAVAIVEVVFVCLFFAALRDIQLNQITQKSKVVYTWTWLQVP